jgi:hypothetical protein
LLKQKKWAEAEGALRESLEFRENKERDAWTTFNAQSMLGAALLGQASSASKGADEQALARAAGFYRDAEPLLLKGYDGMKQRAAKIPEQFRTTCLNESAERLIQFYDAQEKKDEAAKWRKELEALKSKLREETLQLRNAKLGIDHPDTLASMMTLADSYAAIGRHAEVAKIVEELLRIRSSADWAEYHWAVAVLTRCASAAENDEKLSESERMALAKMYTDRVRELLREAIKRGAPVVKGALEAEFLPVSERRNCRPTLQAMSDWGSGKWSNGCQVFCRADKGGYVGFELEVPQPGQYRLSVHFTKAPDFAIVEVSLGGNKIGALFDGYDANVMPSGEVAFGIVELSEGKQNIRFTVINKNPKSTNYFMGIDCLKLERVN